jgi:putative endonuclease
MRLEYNFYVYITANAWHTIYVGVSNDLFRRIWEHKAKAVPGFTSRYGVDRLVYFEHTTDVRAAIAREKQIKVWRRAKKLALIHSMNPEWQDLAADWFTAEQLTNDELRVTTDTDTLWEVGLSLPLHPPPLRSG